MEHDLDLWPRLTRFYGITPLELQKLPRAVRMLYIEQLPEIEAEEQLMRMQAAAYPQLTEEDGRRLHANVRRVAKIAEPEVERVEPLSEEGAAVLGGLGIPVRVKVKGEDDA